MTLNQATSVASHDWFVSLNAIGVDKYGYTVYFVTVIDLDNDCMKTFTSYDDLLEWAGY